MKLCLLSSKTDNEEFIKFIVILSFNDEVP